LNPPNFGGFTLFQDRKKLICSHNIPTPWRETQRHGAARRGVRRHEPTPPGTQAASSTPSAVGDAEHAGVTHGATSPARPARSSPDRRGSSRAKITVVRRPAWRHLLRELLNRGTPLLVLRMPATSTRRGSDVPEPRRPARQESTADLPSSRPRVIDP
jgi:hypothetical protein